MWESNRDIKLHLLCQLPYALLQKWFIFIFTHRHHTNKAPFKGHAEILPKLGNFFNYISIFSLPFPPQMSPTGGCGVDVSDTDMEPTASQSQDCEPTPPLTRHGSKTNFYIDGDASLQGYRPRPSHHGNRTRWG